MPVGRAGGGPEIYVSESWLKFIMRMMKLSPSLRVSFRTQPWEVEKALPDRLKKEMDMVAQNSQLLTIELAHKAAYRSGLGRSMYCPPFAFKKLNSDLLQVRLTQDDLVSYYRTNLSLLQPGSRRSFGSRYTKGFFG